MNVLSVELLKEYLGIFMVRCIYY